jgi:transcriptional regulator with XRE-family HTH domain
MKRERSFSQPVEAAARLLGAQVRQARARRGWTVRGLAERAGVSPSTLLKVEHGDPTVALGIAFEVAALVGVPLFYDDEARLVHEAQREQERARLIAGRVRAGDREPDYDF